MIDGSVKVKCPWCGAVHTVDEWDKNTFVCAKSREERRSFVHLNNEKAFNRKAKKHYYKCPTCENWPAGSQLKIESDDENYKDLGNEPLNIKVIDAR